MKGDPAKGLVTNTSQATELGQSIAALLDAQQVGPAYDLLAPVLGERTPFRLLDTIGRAVGGVQGVHVDRFLERVAAGQAEGGWPVIGSTLGRWLGDDLGGALARCRRYIVAADVWYGADILGERVPGPALVARFEQALARLAPWRQHDSRWVRRAAGVAVHFWAKRSSAAPELASKAESLLDFLEPLFEEREIDAAKGIGWGIKTLGRHYPAQVSTWLQVQLVGRGRQPRAIVLRKARTYLADDVPGPQEDAEIGIKV